MHIRFVICFLPGELEAYMALFSLCYVLAIYYVSYQTTLRCSKFILCNYATWDVPDC